MKKILFLFFIITSITFCFSQENNTPLQKRENVTQRKFNTKALEKYKKDSNFNYEEVKKEPTILEKTIDWIYTQLIRLVSWLMGDRYATGIVSFIFKAIPYLALLILLFLITKFFLKINTKNLTETTNTKKHYVKLISEEELITKANLTQLITKAIEAKNYRLAIRYQYINLIKKLKEKEIITWQQQKTNEDYSKEISNIPLKNKFNKLTHLYDFIWFGNFKITENAYQKTKLDFEKINHLITTKVE